MSTSRDLIPDEMSPTTESLQAVLQELDKAPLHSELDIVEQQALYADCPTEPIPAVMTPGVLHFLHLLRSLWSQ